MSQGPPELREPDDDDIPVAPVGPIDPIPGIMEARTTHLLIGSAGSGKTTLAATLAKQVLAGGPVFTWDGPNGTPLVPCVIYLSGGKPLKAAKKAFKAADTGPVHFYTTVNDHTYKRPKLQEGVLPDLFPKFTHALARVQAQLGTPIPADSLVIVKGISVFFHFNTAGQHSNVVDTLCAINDLCEERKITILLIHTACKRSNDKTKGYINHLDNVNGSSALIEFPSCKFHLFKPEESSDPRLGFHQLLISPAWAPEAELIFQRESDGSLAQVGMDEAAAARAAYEAARAAEAQASPKLSLASKRILGELNRAPEDAPWVITNTLQKLLYPEVPRSTFYKTIKTLLEFGMIDQAAGEHGVPHLRVIKQPLGN